jgi:hypothetical protein
MTYVHFTRSRHDEGRIEIEHHNGYGDRLYWIVSVEVPDLDSTSSEGKPDA